MTNSKAPSSMQPLIERATARPLRSHHWSDASVSQRLSHIGKFVAVTPSLQSSISYIQTLMASHLTAPEGEIAFLLGETRAGKTTAINEVIAETAEETGGRIVSQLLDDQRDSEAMVSVLVKTPNGWERPIVKIFVPKAPTFNALLNDVLLAFDIKLPRSATFAERQLALGRQLKGQATRIVIFDDTQHICEQGKTSAAYEGADVFKVLAKTSQAQVLCVGLEHTIEIKDANPQAKWLGGEVHVVKPHDITAERSSSLATYCATLNKELPFDTPSALGEPDVFLPLGTYCDGYEGRIATIVRLAARYAIERNLPCLNRLVFENYLRDKLQVADRENPFRMTAEELETLPALVAAARKDRIVSAEKRRSQGKRKRIAFGARGR